MMKNFYKKQNGNVLFVILIAVALFAALSAALMDGGSGQSVTSQQSFKFSEEIFTQVQTVRSALVECNLLYNGYPAEPGGTNLVRDVQCNSTGLFAGTGARFLPPPPQGFTEWVYTNDLDLLDSDGTDDGIRVSTSTTNTSQGMINAFTDLSTRKMSANEVDTDTSGTPFTLTVWIVRNTD